MDCSSTRESQACAEKVSNNLSVFREDGTESGEKCKHPHEKDSSCESRLQTAPVSQSVCCVFRLTFL